MKIKKKYVVFLTIFPLIVVGHILKTSLKYLGYIFKKSEIVF